ncbi:hypothetical protein MTR67_000399 [Solanum verrucosum]|uniref:Uncharacterized protein n=1 Tax=Solanum verrucosum TaxID=315347 RepID=A0AAF0T6Y9_SOLVR|nr:hypothetical protein MTR67_000399 [Solanum verrucosum]
MVDLPETQSLTWLTGPRSVHFGKMEIPPPSILYSLFVGVFILLLPDVSVCEPRSQTVQVICGNQLEHNTMIFVPNLVEVMETISKQMITRGYGVAVTGTGPTWHSLSLKKLSTRVGPTR